MKQKNVLFNKKTYNRGGKWGKLKGFEFYLRYENRMRPNQRKEFLKKSEEYISLINETITKDIPYMDDKFSDIELMEAWNDIWDNWGWLIPEFNDKWVRDKLKNGR